jgi:histidyl-tRNA synthetase
MAELIQAIRGMNDILPDSTVLWRKIEQLFRECVKLYGYDEIRLPIVESTQLFKRTIGEVTDIVEKEMYTFTDLNGESISLRPEGTAGTVRACLEHGLLYNQIQRLWYMGPMFRHEKPQKGRYRQFNHFGVEVFGIDSIAIELELLSMCQRLWKCLGIDEYVTLEINTIGTLEERQQYRSILVDYFLTHEADLDEDSLRRLHRNPLRILDSKNPKMQAIIDDAPRLLEVMGESSRALFDDLCKGLSVLGISYHINPCLVRGLDYYGHTVFEWVTDKLGSQSTVCAGGRYDSLVSQLGGQATPAVGFALGVERLLILLQALDSFQAPLESPSVFIIAEPGAAMLDALTVAETLREAGCSVLTNTVGGSFKSQFKKADKSGASIALIIGEAEHASASVGVKWLREDKPQTTCLRKEVLEVLGLHS